MQFHILRYKISARWYRNKNWGCLIMYVEQGVTWKHLQKLKTIKNESICSELTIAKTNWLCFIICRYPKPENLKFFFGKLTNCLSKGSESWDRFITLGDFNINAKVTDREPWYMRKIFLIIGNNSEEQFTKGLWKPSFM